MKFIVACDQMGGIGNKGELLFRLSDDLSHFKRLTINNVVVMGKNTYLSLPEDKRPLSNRVNIVLSSSMEEQAGVIVARDLSDLFAKLKQFKKQEIFVIGGAKVYEQLCPYCSGGFITFVNAKCESDVKFELPQSFRYISKQPMKIDPRTRYSYQILEVENTNLKIFHKTNSSKREQN